ncbi:MAG: hypothetical protein J1F20_08065 [Muribaculaceae bacterium]|nr:hypothetical protein [Muribaculaceae bacterium]
MSLTQSCEVKPSLFLVVAFILACFPALASKYSYAFDNTPISQAVVRISKEDPHIHISFIYRELDEYTTSAKIDTDNAYQALRQIIGMNPVSLVNKGNHYYIEALQRGKYNYYGNVFESGNEPVVGASIMLLAPKDSSVITYGITDSNGYFSIPCDKKNVIAKFSCIGYKTVFIDRPQFMVGAVNLEADPIYLSTLSVEADNTVLSSNKNIYTPTTNQKNASQDASDLLRRMGIPQLVINPGDNTVKDLFGNSVTIFINYHEAQPEELIGMKITDVRRVEYIEFPGDPRFKGKDRVINFIVQEYKYGGYTKASESFKTFNGIYNNSDVFSRFTYKKMTYNIYGGSHNQSYHHSGADISSHYVLEHNNEPVTISRKEIIAQSQAQKEDYPLTFQATYNSPRFSVRNNLSFTHSSMPKHNITGNLIIDENSPDNNIFNRDNLIKNNMIYYQSNLGGLIGTTASFDITPSFEHTHRNNFSFYKSSYMHEPINNIITENAYTWGIQATGRLILKQKNQLSVFLSGGQNIYNLVYRGSTNSNDSYYNSFLIGSLRYRYQSNKFTLTSFVGFGFDNNSLNKITTQDIFPNVGINARLSLNKKSQISANISYQTTTPDISLKANDIIRNNEYIYLTGNPKLKNWRNLNTNFLYNWVYSNSFSLAAFAGYGRDFNRVATIYRPYDDGKALIRDFVNDGSFIHYYLGLSGNYKLFNNRLQLYANLTQNVFETTGDYKKTLYPFRIQLQVVYYWKSFNVLASCGNPQCSLTENSNYIIRGRNFHMFSIGWGNGIWVVNLAARNIFNSGWISETWETQVPFYSEYKQVFNPSVHPNLNLSITYTIGYGKKIQRGNEVGGKENGPSAIVR